MIPLTQPDLTEAQRQLGEQKKQLFLHRVNLLLNNIKQWATEAGLQVTAGQVPIREKFTGLYTAPSLTIGLPEQKLADVIPVSAFVIVADGLLKVSGWLGREHIAYLLKAEQTFYPIAQDDWYWIEETTDNKAHLMSKDTLLTVISMVSDYEF